MPLSPGDILTPESPRPSSVASSQTSRQSLGLPSPQLILCSPAQPAAVVPSSPTLWPPTPAGQDRGGRAAEAAVMPAAHGEAAASPDRQPGGAFDGALGAPGVGASADSKEALHSPRGSIASAAAALVDAVENEMRMPTGVPADIADVGMDVGMDAMAPSPAQTEGTDGGDAAPSEPGTPRFSDSLPTSPGGRLGSDSLPASVPPSPEKEPLEPAWLLEASHSLGQLIEHERQSHREAEPDRQAVDDSNGYEPAADRHALDQPLLAAPPPPQTRPPPPIGQLTPQLAIT